MYRALPSSNMLAVLILIGGHFERCLAAHTIEAEQEQRTSHTAASGVRSLQMSRPSRPAPHAWHGSCRHVSETYRSQRSTLALGDRLRKLAGCAWPGGMGHVLCRQHPVGAYRGSRKRFDLK